MPDDTGHESYISIARSTGEIRITSVQSVANGIVPHPSEHAIAGLALPTATKRGDLTATHKLEAAKTVRDVAALNFQYHMQAFNETTCPVQRAAVHQRTRKSARDEQAATLAVERYRNAAYVEMGLRPRETTPDVAAVTALTTPGPGRF